MREIQEGIVIIEYMMVALIHWRIKPDEESNQDFLEHWKTRNIIVDRSELIAEFLTESLPVRDFPDITWYLDSNSLGDFKSYVTVGLWNNSEAFKKQVARYFNDKGCLESFEKYRRRRTVFNLVEWRVGKKNIPTCDSPGVK